MKSVIFLSPPLGGKGTMSEYLVNNYNYGHISTGDILRKKALEDKELSEFLKSGKLVSDEVMLSLIEETLLKLDKSRPFILDGMPRTLHQAQELDIILNGLDLSDYVVVYIDVDKDILFKRVLGRKTCPSCHKTYNSEVEEFKPKVENHCDVCGSTLMSRSDDNLSSYQIRYDEFMKSTYPLKEYYDKLGRLKVIQNNLIDQTSTLEMLVGDLSD